MPDIPRSKHTLDFLFPPRAIAFAGVSTDPKKRLSGRSFMETVIAAGYKGKIYPVSPSGGEIDGRTIYRSVQDIPDTVDYAISAVPARHNIQLLRDCAARGVKVLQIFSSGFSEIANPEGKKLEEELTRLARETGVRVIGPNCMGVYAPKYGLAFPPGLPEEAGSVGFISQSGSNSFQVVGDGNLKGVYFSKLFSYGNAADLNESDFLEYLAQDPETSVIGVYIEGVKDGTHFLKTLKKTAGIKPVIVYKAGNTDSGMRAVASHSGMMAGSRKIWQAALRQSGAIAVNSMEELADLLVLFQHMSPVRGTNALFFGVGGGTIVQSTDELAEAGIYLPPLSVELRRQLEKIHTTEAGASFRNPIDFYLGKAGLMQSTIEMIVDAIEVDVVIVQIIVGQVSYKQPSLWKPFIDAIVNLKEKLNHRTAVIIRPAGKPRFSADTLKLVETFVNAGYPVFESARNAATAIGRFVDYHRKRQSPG